MGSYSSDALPASGSFSALKLLVINFLILLELPCILIGSLGYFFSPVRPVVSNQQIGAPRIRAGA